MLHIGDTIYLNTEISYDNYTTIYKDKVFGKDQYLTQNDKETYFIIKSIMRMHSNKVDETAHLKVSGEHTNNYTVRIDDAMSMGEVLLPKGFVPKARQLDKSLAYKATNGVIYTVGDPTVIAKGSAPKGKYKYLNQIGKEPEAVIAQSLGEVHTYADQNSKGHTVYIQKIHYLTIDNKEVVAFTVAVNTLFIMTLDIEGAIATCEIEVCK